MLYFCLSICPTVSCPTLRNVGTICLAGWGHWPLRWGAGRPSWLRPRLGRDPVLPPWTTHLAVDEDHRAQQPPRAPLAVDVQHPQDLEEADAPAEDRSLCAPPPCAPPPPLCAPPPPPCAPPHSRSPGSRWRQNARPGAKPVHFSIPLAPRPPSGGGPRITPVYR